eukprot:Gb_26215 [translate_table: standard]
MIPLSYQIKPWQVRHPDNEGSPYAKAFQDHSTKGRYTPERINQWKSSLGKASDLSGWSLEEHAAGYEGKLVKQVAMEILKTLDNIGSLDVAKHPVGLKERMDKVKVLLRADPNDKSVRTLGIWGMGGIGKTTLSKALFNDIKSMFNACCFLSDVRERAKKGLTKLQEQILKDLLKNEFEVNSVDEGKMIMRESLGSKRALLILDDVDDKKQLEALHEDQWFGGGSRVIITTRDKHILNLAPADEIYEAEDLDHNEALELFSWHAFLGVSPDEGYEDLSMRVVHACRGLPLSLEAMGAHLYDKKDNKAFWNEAVIRIESMRDKDLYETLKISFNGLQEEERQIFLDIACFFNKNSYFRGADKATAIEIWKAIGCKNPHTAIENLSLKSLIRIDKLNDSFSMHDHLRDLGREIVAEESREDPCKRSRLWHPRDVRRVLRESKGLSGLQVFCLSANRIPEWLKLRLHRMLKPEKRGWDEYWVVEDAKCTGIVVCLRSVAETVKVNISTEDNKISRQIELPSLIKYNDDENHVGRIQEDDDEYDVGIIQEELPSTIKFRSGDIIRCHVDGYGAKIVGVYLVLDQNDSGNDDVYYSTQISLESSQMTSGRNIVSGDFEVLESGSGSGSDDVDVRSNLFGRQIDNDWSTFLPWHPSMPCDSTMHFHRRVEPVKLNSASRNGHPDRGSVTSVFVEQYGHHLRFCRPAWPRSVAITTPLNASFSSSPGAFALQHFIYNNDVAVSACVYSSKSSSGDAKSAYIEAAGTGCIMPAGIEMYDIFVNLFISSLKKLRSTVMATDNMET